MYDWNQNGKNDTQDHFVEYNIYHDNSSNTSNDFQGGSFNRLITVFIAIFVTYGILLVASWVVDLVNPKKAYKEYKQYQWNQSEENNDYGENHYNDSYNETIHQSKQNSNTVQTPKVQTDHSYRFSKSTEEDIYHAKDYSDAEDFYDDNADDFDDFEDAEDYYEEHGEE